MNMRYFKDAQGMVHGFDASDTAQVALMNVLISGWTEITGSWPPASTLDSIKQGGKSKIDAAAENCRLQYITNGSGQAMTYWQKYQEALTYQAAAAAGPVTDTSPYPHLVAEVGITAADVPGVAAAVVAQFQALKAVSPAIEKIRLGAKAQVDALTDATTAQAQVQAIAAALTWPTPPAA